MQFNAIQCNAIQFNSMQCNAIQCNATKIKVLQPSMIRTRTHSIHPSIHPSTNNENKQAREMQTSQHHPANQPGTHGRFSVQIWYLLYDTSSLEREYDTYIVDSQVSQSVEESVVSPVLHAACLSFSRAMHGGKVSLVCM